MTTPTVRREGGHRVLRAPDSPFEPELWHFDPDSLEERARITGTGSGRQAAWFFEHEGRALVLRHYRRGGLVGRLVEDSYLWTGLIRSRPWRELELLVRLMDENLPVSPPVGAHLHRRGLRYRADLLTVMIPRTRTFAARIHEGSLGQADWMRVGRTIRAFHDAGAHHADLNVRNILIDDDGAVWLIDWDRGRIRPPGGRWAARTMQRLDRSLRKEPELAHVAERHWTTLVHAWESG